ncbi:MAG TPA: DUF4157 domain-containing protein [Blastocatellia bacterium]|nr:DUF4157 domain-containing protein [Blastocatellia bacterium]
MPLKTSQQESKENAVELRAPQQTSFAQHPPAPITTASTMLKLQRTHGNRFLQRALNLARKAESEAEAAPEIEEAIRQAPDGRPLESRVRAQMESAFGADFGGVRVHTGANAEALNEALNARAFTTGQDIFFGKGEYDPGSASGRELLAHELTHVQQQRGSVMQGKLAISQPGDVYEQEADRMARAVMEQERQTAPGREQMASASGKYQPGTPIGDTMRAHESAHETQRRASQSASPAVAERERGQKTREAGADETAREAAGSAGKKVERPLANIAQTVRPQLKSGPRVSLDGPGPKKPGPKDAGSAPAPVANATVNIGPVNAPNTPPAIKRIPPRVDTDVAVTVTGGGSPAPTVTLSIEGAGAANGTATINGSATHNLTSSATVKLKGDTQTTPGNAGKLKLVASQGTTRLAESNAFSVAAYPKEIGFKFNRVMRDEPFPGVPGRFWGAAYDLTFVSDSGVKADCDKTKISENVLVDTGTGLWAGVTPTTSDFLRTTDSQTDHHAKGAADAAGMRRMIDADPGSVSIQHQFFRFSCERTGIAEDKAAGPKVPTSGFKISRHVSAPSSCGSSKHFLHCKKEGFANNGVAAGTVDDTSVQDAEV